ncbi:sorbin and SH3 domain-containing protein 1-like [Hemitrygon akajei]|uniref:sorbin and SH3 domain-containing protein 1-like n=1 Tax=Hemitrygon akajei TaxID=2704970 RepID=UPI003BF9C540
MKETGRSFESLLLKETREPALCLSGDGGLQKSATLARGCPIPNGFVNDVTRFIKLQQNMHQFSPSRHRGAGPGSPVRDVLLQSKCSPTFQSEQNADEDELESFSRCSVSSRVSQFEQIIQRSRSMPSLDLGNVSTSAKSPVASPSTSFLQSAQSAESLLDPPPQQYDNPKPDVQISIQGTSASGSEVEEEEGAPKLSEVVVTKTVTPRPCVELDCLSLLSAKSCTSGCHSVNAHTASQYEQARLISDTRFTALYRHRGQTTDSPLTAQHPSSPLSRNLFLLSPRPFRLKQPFFHRFRSPLAYVDSASQTEAVHGVGRLLDNPVMQGPLSNTKPSHPMRTTSLRIVETLRHLAASGPCRGVGIWQPDLSKGSAGTLLSSKMILS